MQRIPNPKGPHSSHRTETNRDKGSPASRRAMEGRQSRFISAQDPKECKLHMEFTVAFEDVKRPFPNSNTNTKSVTKKKGRGGKREREEHSSPAMTSNLVAMARGKREEKRKKEKGWEFCGTIMLHYPFQSPFTDLLPQILSCRNNVCLLAPWPSYGIKLKRQEIGLD